MSEDKDLAEQDNAMFEAWSNASDEDSPLAYFCNGFKAGVEYSRLLKNKDIQRWINKGGWEYGDKCTCPACNTDHYHFYGENNYGKIANFCSSCGIKLLPPEENHEK